MIKCYLINLDRDSERLKHMQHVFDQMGCIFDRLAAVDASLLSEHEVEAFCKLRNRRRNRWGRGQIGCFLSHLAIWKKIAEGPDECVAVFEDDLHFSPLLREVLSSTAWIPRDFDIVRLETSTNRLLLSKEILGKISGCNVYRVISTSWCAGMYIMSRRCAKKLIAVPDALHDTADRFLFSFEDSPVAKYLRIYQVSPALATQDKHLLEKRNRIGFESNLEQSVRTGDVTCLSKLFSSFFPLSLYRTLRGYKPITFLGTTVSPD